MPARHAGHRALDDASERDRLAPQRPQNSASANISARHDGQPIVASRARQ
jgi:hypothetical protein